MTTFYVAKSGNDSNSGRDQGAPKLTIAGAITVADVSPGGHTIEIIDSGQYDEANLEVTFPGLTITHTASSLARPQIYDSTGAESWIFRWNTNVTGNTLQGLELGPCKGGVLFSTSAQTQRTFHLTGCFVHGVPKLVTHAIEGNGVDDPCTIHESVIYGTGPGTDANALILVNGSLYIRNSLVTSSKDSPGYLLKNYAGANVTASFSTFINRDTASTYPVIQASKVINCIVSGSPGTDGIASNDHSYNLVHVGGPSFKNLDNSATNATGSGDITGRPPEFVAGTVQGETNAIAANYKLQSTSPAINYGTPYLLTAIDISGNSRPTAGGAGGSLDNPDMGCFEYPTPYWGDYGTENYPHFASDFTVNLYLNTTADYKLRYADSPGQVPFFLGPKGPISLRKDKAYLVTEGDPSVMTGSG